MEVSVSSAERVFLGDFLNLAFLNKSMMDGNGETLRWKKRGNGDGGGESRGKELGFSGEEGGEERREKRE